MPIKEGKYNIKAVSKLLGIQPGTLRAWERRYGVVSPGRSESGHRLYSESQLEILREIMTMIEQGFTVGQAVAQIGQRPTLQSMGKRPFSQLEEFRNALFDGFLEFDEVNAHRTIDACLSQFTFETVLSDIFHPLLTEMEGSFVKGSMNHACFLFGSGLIRSRIENTAFAASGKRFLPRVVLLCAPGEQKDIWLLLLAGLLRLKGFDAIYLGPGIAEGEIDGVIKKVNPRFAFFSCMTESGADIIKGLSYSWKRVFPEIRIGAIGAGLRIASGENTDSPSFPLYLGDTPAEWEQWLNKWMDTI
ncbi:MerR family transcriptional regulator [Neobacillus piezotolerans]|uniref:MerR family transcriptional regulator n=1 Tax=Neobacillus piezotolerans TaxID=2259171 RepID=UPI001156D036|nr:MerR family transcriptional regulator [Neobacillus piezotolerans]